MANNYSQFSEMIENLTPEACEWVETVLTFDLDDYDGDNDDGAEERHTELKALLSLEGDGVDLEYWPSFEWKIEGSGVGASVKHSLWLYSEEGCDYEHVEIFVRELICRFMPDYIFTMTSAETCSKPRLGEFGGGWLVIHKDGAEGGNTWDAASDVAKHIKEGRLAMPRLAKPTVVAPDPKGRE